MAGIVAVDEYMAAAAVHGGRLMSYVDRVGDSDVVDVWEDEIPGVVLDRLGRPRSKTISLRACFPRGIPNRLFCVDNDRKFSRVYTFRRVTRPTGVHYVLGGTAARPDVEAVFRAFSDPSYAITKDRERGPRAYTAWHGRTAKGPDFQEKQAERVVA